MEDKKKEEELIQEETAVQPEKSGEEKEEQTETHQGGLPMRSCVLMLLAGLYLLYTGYKLCQNVLNGVEGGNWGFFAAGVGFLIVGAVMLFIAGKNYLRREKEKKEAQEKEIQNNPLPKEEPEERKTMSIAERARLAQNLSDREEEETEENREGTEEKIQDASGENTAE